MITRAEIFVQILSEVSGKPRHKVACRLTEFRKTHPGNSWDRKIPRNEAQRLLTDLRKDAPAIMSWVVSGSRCVADKTTKDYPDLIA